MSDDGKKKGFLGGMFGFAYWLIKKVVLIFIAILVIILVISLLDMLIKYTANTNRDYNMAQDFISNYKRYFNLFFGFIGSIFKWLGGFFGKFFHDLTHVNGLMPESLV